MRLAHSSTCSSLLILNQTYDNDSCLLFERELDFAFFYSEGFDEVVYRSAYNQIDRQVEPIDNNNNIPVVDYDVVNLTTNDKINNDVNEPEQVSNDELNGESK